MAQGLTGGVEKEYIKNAVSGSVDHGSSLDYEHNRSHSTPLIMAQYIENDIVYKCLDRNESRDFKQEKIFTSVSSGGVEAGSHAYIWDMACACELSNGNIAFAYRLDADNDLYIKIINPFTDVEIKSETAIQTNAVKFIQMISVPEDETFIVGYYDIDGDAYKFIILNNDGTTAVSTVTVASGNYAHADGYCSLALFPDQDHFAFIFCGNSADVNADNGCFRIYDSTSGSAVSSIICPTGTWGCANNFGYVTDEELLVVGYAEDTSAVPRFYVYDCSTPATPTDAYSGGSYFSPTWLEYYIFHVWMGVNPDDNNRFTWLCYTDPQDQLAIHQMELQGTGANRTIVQISTTMTTEANGFPYWGGCINSYGDSLIVCTTASAGRPDPTNVPMINLFDKNGFYYNNGDYSIGGVAYEYGRAIPITGGFALIGRNTSDSNKLYYSLIRKEHFVIEIIDANNVKVWNWSNKTRTIKATVVGV